MTVGGKSARELTPLRPALTRSPYCLGWTVTYIQQVRGGGASSGYVSSGFFGGMFKDSDTSSKRELTDNLSRIDIWTCGPYLGKQESKH